ncbi:MAG: SEL1-like repeat protein [Rhizobiaceae bacterium]|nr:SEL1-like repeat protein [Rhizobiaceae bacterium]
MKRGDRLPYPGLRAYQRDETDLFFGRDGCVNEMVDKLAATRFLAVLGASGAGKSSLVRTGLFDALELGFMQDAGSNWMIVDFHPAGRPLRQLAAALLEARDGRKPAAEETATLEAFLRRGPGSVLEWIADGNLPAGHNLLLMADQFEELFRYGDYAGRETAEAFAALLLESARLSERVFVVITMRSEYLGACALVPGLAEQINASLYLARRMTREECRQAIVGPARVFGFDIEPRLVTRLLNDLASFAPWEEDRERSQLHRLARQADQLPLMQHVLSRLWQRARLRGEGRTTLTFDDYEEIGFLEGALDQHGDEVIASLSPDAQPIVQSVFRALVAGSSLADAVRRPLPFARLVEIVGADRTLVAEVVDAFRAPGCNFLRPALNVSLTDDTMIDISHESLIRQWGRLAAWFGEEARSAATWSRLIGATERYRAGEGSLLVGLDFANARAWFEQARPTPGWADLHSGKEGATQSGQLAAVEAFLAESQANAERDEREREERLEQERRQQRELLAMREQERDSLRKRYAMLVALAVVCLLAAGYFLYANGRLTEATTRAEQLAASEAAARAEAEQLAASEADARAEAEQLAASEAEARAEADEKAAEAASAAEAAANAATQAEQAAAEAKRQEQEAEFQRRRAADALALAEERLAQAQVNLAKFLSYAALDKPNSVLAMGLILAALPVDLPTPPENDRIATVPACRTGVKCPALETAGSIIPAAVDAFARLSARDRLVAVMRFGSRSVQFTRDGKRVAAAYGYRARVWDVATGYEFAEMVHDGNVRTVDLSPDDSKAVTAGDDDTVRIWDAGTGKELRKIALDGDGIIAVFSPDGARILTGDGVGFARVWNAETGTAIATFEHGGAIQSAAFSPDGATVASASDEGLTVLWNASTGAQIAALDSAAAVSQLSFSPDGKHLLTVSWEDVSVWDALTGKLVTPIKHDAMPNFAAFSQDGTRIAVGLSDGTARVWELSGPRLVQLARLRHEGSVWWAEFSPDGSSLATASSDQTARVWDTTNWRETLKVMHDEQVNALAFSPDGTHLATSSVDVSTRIWDVRPSVDAARLEHEYDVYTAAFSADGDQIVSTTGDGRILLWDAHSGARTMDIRHSDEALSAFAALSPDGRLLATASTGPAQLWEVATKTRLGEFGEDSTAYSVKFSPDGRFVLTDGADNTVRIWDAATRQEVARTVHDDTIVVASFSPDSRRFASAAYDGGVRIGTIGTRDEVKLSHGDSVYALMFSPDGKRLITASSDGAARIWGSETGSLQLLIDESASVYETAFSPDGAWVATAATDGQVRIRSSTSGALRLAVKVGGAAYEVSFSADGERILTLSDEGVAQVWDIATGTVSSASASGDSVSAMGFSPDGTQVLAASGSVIRVWKSLTTADALAVARASEVRGLTAEEQLEYSVPPAAWEIALKENRARFNECDFEAGHPHDPLLGPGGKDFEDMDAPTAIAACQNAVEAFPNEGRYRYQLGRALRKAERRTDAVRNYDAAAAMGYPMAFYNLGIGYTEGEGVPKDGARAVAMYRQAVALGVPAAAHNLAWLYWRGESVEQDRELARKYWSIAANAGHGPAAWRLAELAENTAESGAPQDLAEALYGYARATRFYEYMNEPGAATSTRFRRATLARNLSPDVVVEQWRRASAFIAKPIDPAALPQ